MANEIQDLTKKDKTLNLVAPKEIEVLNANLGGTPGVNYKRIAEEVKTPEQATKAQAELYGQMEPQRQRLAEMEVEKGRVDAANRARLAESELTKVQTAESERERIYKTNPFPKLNPTQENVQSLATLFSLIGVVGFGVGGEGKMSAMGSLKAMTGMMKGWQQGRKDLWDRETKEFEKNMAATKAILDAADKEVDRIYKILPFDRQKAESEMAALTASLGGQILKQKTEMQGIEQGILYIKDLKKTNDDAYDRAFKERKETREAEHARQMEKFKEREIDISKQRLEIDRLRAQKDSSARATQQLFIVQRAVNALGGVASSMESISQIPAGTTVGILGNLTTKDGMTNYLRNFAGRKVSKPEEKAMETLFTGITRNLASIEASGTAMGLTVLATQLEKLRPVAGDSAYDVALKMADIRRISTENIQPLIDSGLMPKQQQQTAQLLVNRIERAIPYTTIDVVNALPTRGRKTTGEAGSEVGERGQLNEKEKKRLKELEAKERGE